MGMGMPSGENICPQCGWHNEAIARMCGGCGQLLPQRLAPLDTRIASTVALPGAGVAPYLGAADDTPTVVAPEGAAAPPYPAYRPAAAPVWAPASGRAASISPTSAAKRGSCLLRAVVVLLVVVLLLGCLSVGLWTLVIRPPLHAQMDRGIRTAVGTVVTQANTALERIPPGVGGSARVPAAQINAELQRDLPSSLPVHNVALDFSSGGVVVHYTLGGRPGAFFVGLVAQNGRLLARNATVTGPLKLVESSSELLQAVRTEFAGLSSTVSITSVSTADHMLIVTVRANQNG
jgi:hypothetical protein